VTRVHVCPIKQTQRKEKEKQIEGKGKTNNNRNVRVSSTQVLTKGKERKEEKN
jgi:hypothetical protein